MLEVVAPALVPLRATITPDAVDDPTLDPPPPVEADWVAGVGAGDVFHVECQGYRDESFADRLFRYHLALTLRYPRRRVHTIAIWVIRPAARERIDEVVREGVRVRVTAVVLSEIDADRLLADPRTACFAAGARAGELGSDEELCRRVVIAMRDCGASYRSKVLAVALAGTVGRFDAMVRAMKQEKIEPVFIEDLFRLGEDRGLEKGLEKGREEGRIETARRALMVVLDARGLSMSEAERSRIEAERSVETLMDWQRRAVTGASVAEVLAD